MYYTGVIMYLILPAFIIVSWYAVKIVVASYERKFPDANEQQE